MTTDFDRWLTTDRVAEAADALHQILDEAWTKWSAEHGVPLEACEDDHPAHQVYEAWLNLYVELDAYYEAKAEAELDEALAAQEAEGYDH